MHTPVRRGIHRDVLSRIDNRLHRDCSGSERDCSAGHRPRKLHLSRLGQTFLGALDGAT